MASLKKFHAVKIQFNIYKKKKWLSLWKQTKELCAFWHDFWIYNFQFFQDTSGAAENNFILKGAPQREQLLSNFTFSVSHLISEIPTVTEVGHTDFED